MPAGPRLPRNTPSTSLPAVEPATAHRPIRVLLADDHQMFREALRRMLQAEPGVEVVGEAADGHETLRLASTVAADVLLLDLAMPGLSGLEVLKRLNESGSIVRVILLTGTSERRQEADAIRLGARGVVIKSASVAMLVKSIRHVVAGHYWVGHDQMDHLIEVASGGGTPRPADTLTRRERQVITAIAQGATNRQIAEQLGLSSQTVKNHLSNIFDKLGVSNRLELVLFAVHHNLIVDSES